MTVYNTAYQTTACAKYLTGKVVDGIEEARRRDYISNVDGLLLVASTKGAQGFIPQFTQPMYIGEHGVEHLRTHAEEQLSAFLAVDVRTAGRFESPPGEAGIVGSGSFKVTNESLYKSIVYRGGLTALWLTQGTNLFRAMAPVALPIYATWLAEMITQRFLLDPKARYDLVILSALFYMSNHVDELELGKENESRMLSWVAKSLKFDMSDVTKIYDQTKIITSVEDFCNKVILVLNNVKISPDKFNKGLLVALASGTWFAGPNPGEDVAVALEHPPTWISIVLEAYTNKSVRKSIISQICERSTHKDGLEAMLRNVKNEMKNTFSLLNDINAR